MTPELDDTLAARGATMTAPGRPLAHTSGNGAGADGLALGQRLGHFAVERKLGAGGMGEVYLAMDTSLDRHVALKVLPEAYASDPIRRDRMIREARAQARVTHPNVAHIYFVGQEADRLYFAMEYVAGQTLGERIASGPLAVEDALVLVRAAALGLREAQRMGFTHRDVKPSNLMIDSHGILKVVDFGLAAGDAGAIGAGPVAQTSMAGTPLYMAPEQARGEAIDFRVDIYALGATLYHLVSGHPPFEADTLDELLSLHATAARPALRRRGVPHALVGTVDALIARMMAARAEDRFASYDELIRALDLASTTQTRPAGFWVRSIATIIDFLLATLGFALITFLVSLVHAGSSGLSSGAILLVLYAVCSLLAIRRWGSTPGQLLFELEVIDYTTGRRPAWRPTLARIIAVFALPALGTVTSATVAGLGYEQSIAGQILIAVIWLANGVMLLWASVRSPGKRAPWDRLSHTMVHYRGATARS